MAKETGIPPSGSWRIADIRWKSVALGCAIGLLGTLVVGLPLLLSMEDSRLMALAGSVGLLIGGLVAGRGAGRPLAVVNGALMAILYNFTVSLAFFVGSFLELLPEPMPGLPQGDSTYFFAWPLVQFVIGILSTVLGSRFARRGSRE